MLTALAWVIAIPVAAITTIFLVEMIAGLVRPRRADLPGASVPVTVVVVPAHNEAISIAATLDALFAVLPKGGRVLVVADNCTDDTAEIARKAGASVVERHDPDRRGKGFALAFARDTLVPDPPEVVAVVDADCVPTANSLAALAIATARDGRPVQAINLLRSGLDAPPMVQISSFAFLVKNLVRQRGAARVGDVAILGGTGMAMPWQLFAAAPLANDNIVEDLALGIWATRQGFAPCLVEAARVESNAAAREDTLGQRARWEHGFLQTARKYAFPLIVEGATRRNRALLWMGLHLCVPPLALLVTIAALALVLLAGLAVLGASALPVSGLAATTGLAGVAIVVAWMREGRKTLNGRTLVQIPLYVLWKIPNYLKLLTGKRSGWRRTPREGETSDGPSG